MIECAPCESEEVFEIVIIQNFLFSKNFEKYFNFEQKLICLINLNLLGFYDCDSEMRGGVCSARIPSEANQHLERGQCQTRGTN